MAFERIGSEMVPESQAPMNLDNKEMLMIHLVRFPEVFQAAQHSLESKHFDPQLETGYLLVWDVIKEFWGLYRQLPSRDVLLTLITRRLDEDPDCLVEEARADLEQFVRSAFILVAEDLVPKWGLFLLSEFLREREVGVARRMLGSVGTDVPLQFPRMVQELYERCRRIEHLQPDTGYAAIPDDYCPTPLGKHTTGLPFLDRMMNGGQACHEVYGLLGPTGTGKSLMGLQIAIEGARYQQSLANTTGEPPGHWFFFSYELPIEELRVRVLSYAAEIHRSVLEEVRDWNVDLQRSDNPREYEKEIYRIQQASGSPFLGEWERLQLAKSWINKNLWLYDMRGQDGRGTGGIGELVSILEHNHKSLSRPVAGVVVDYAGEVVDKQLLANNEDFSHKRHYLLRFGSDAGGHIATPFNCPVWLIHQLAGAVGGKSASSAPHHTDAAESKSFANPLWFCFQMGNKFKNSNCCLFSVTKQRRAPGMAEILLEIDGAFGRMRGAEDRYALDPVTNKLVTRDTMSTFAEPSQAQVAAVHAHHSLPIVR